MPNPEQTFDISVQNFTNVPDYFAHVIRSLVADHIDFALTTTVGPKNVEAVHFINKEAEYSYAYTSLDTSDGTETLGLALRDHRVKLPFGEDYEVLRSYRSRTYSNEITVGLRHYFENERRALVNRYDHAGGKIIKREVPVHNRSQASKAVILELQTDLIGLRQDCKPIKTTSIYDNGLF